LNDAIRASHKALQDLRFDLLAQILYEFVWNEFCDWYVELAKINLNASQDSAQKTRILSVMVTVLETIYRLLHPIMPFITEELWQSMAPLLGLTDVSIMLRAFPEVNPTWHDSEALAQVTDLKAWVGAIRQIRSDYTLAPSKRLPLVYIKGATQASQFGLQRELMQLVKSDACQLVAANFEPACQCAAHIVDGVEILLPLTDLIDPNAAQERLAKMKKEWDKTQQEIDKVAAKLANAAYVEKAPAAVVTAERERLALLQLTAQQLHSKINA
jgi:valyl-tRNA synthetase